MVVVAGGVGEGDTDGGMSVSGNNHLTFMHAFMYVSVVTY